MSTFLINDALVLKNTHHNKGRGVRAKVENGHRSTTRTCVLLKHSAFTSHLNNALRAAHYKTAVKMPAHQSCHVRGTSKEILSLVFKTTISR